MKPNAPNDLYAVCVYPDDEQYTKPPSWKSDDYELRATAPCEECDDELDIHYQEPLASCACGTQEWYYDYPDYKWAQPSYSQANFNTNKSTMLDFSGGLVAHLLIIEVL